MELEKPEPTDCCGNGCSPCVFDIYERRLESWRKNMLNVDTSYRKDLLSETRFKPFQLIYKEQLTEDVYLFHFRPEVGNNQLNEISGFLPYGIGQHLILKCNLSIDHNKLKNVDPPSKFESKSKCLENQRTITRAFTPVTLSRKEKNCCFRFFAKLYRNGIGSEYLRSLQVGDISQWRGPYGEFNYKPNSFKYILMICIGSGLAPMIPIADHILSNDSDETILHLFYGVKSVENVIMRNTLRGMTQYWNFTLEYYFSVNKTENNSMKFGESFHSKRIDQCSVNKFIDGKELKRLLVLVCGSDSFNLFIKNVVTDLGIDPKNIFIF